MNIIEKAGKKETDAESLEQLEQFYEEMKQLMKDTAKVFGVKINVDLDAEPKDKLAKPAPAKSARLQKERAKSLEEEMDECIRKASLEFEAYLDSLEA